MVPLGETATAIDVGGFLTRVSEAAVGKGGRLERCKGASGVREDAGHEHLATLCCNISYTGQIACLLLRAI